MVVVSGFNVYPREVEDALLLHPGVSEAAVIGVADPHKGEALQAVVVPRKGAALTAAALADHLGGLLARYKVPQHFTWSAGLPKTVVGKIDKQALRRS